MSFVNDIFFTPGITKCNELKNTGLVLICSAIFIYYPISSINIHYFSVNNSYNQGHLFFFVSWMPIHLLQFFFFLETGRVLLCFQSVKKRLSLLRLTHLSRYTHWSTESRYQNDLNYSFQKIHYKVETNSCLRMALQSNFKSSSMNFTFSFPIQ